jgi:hypothetical protein
MKHAQDRGHAPGVVHGRGEQHLVVLKSRVWQQDRPGEQKVHDECKGDARGGSGARSRQANILFPCRPAFQEGGAESAAGEGRLTKESISVQHIGDNPIIETFHEE